MGVPTYSKEVTDEVGGLLRISLRERFRDDLTSDPIVVVNATDQYGDIYLDAVVVYEGPYAKLDPNWILGLTTRLNDELLSLGVTNVVSQSFVTKKEWEKELDCKHPRAYES